MKKYLMIWWRIQASNFGRDLNLGWNLVIRLLGSLCFVIMHLSAFYFLLKRFSFPGWSTHEIWTLLFTFELFTYLAFFLFSRGLVRTLRDINKGSLDYLLTKPRSLRFLTFFRGGSIHNFVAAAIALTVVVISASNLLVYLTLIIASLWVFHCLAATFISLNLLWGYVPGSDSFMFEIQEVYKYPASTYDHFPWWVQILIVPLAALTTIPTLLLLNKPIAPSILIIYIASGIFLTLFSHWLWNKALRHYSSASS